MIPNDKRYKEYLNFNAYCTAVGAVKCVYMHNLLLLSITAVGEELKDTADTAIRANLARRESMECEHSKF